MVGKMKVTMFSTFQHLSAFWRRLSTNFTVRFLNNLVKSSGFLWPSHPPTPFPPWSSPSSATPLYFLFTLNLIHHLSKKCRYKIDSDFFFVLTSRVEKGTGIYSEPYPGTWIDLLVPGSRKSFWWAYIYCSVYENNFFFHFLPSFDFYLSLKNFIYIRVLKYFKKLRGFTGVENCEIQIPGSRSRPVADSPLRLKSLQMSFYVIGEQSIFSMFLQFQSVLFSSCIFWLRFSDTLHSK